jgi:hypothetical protein
VIAVGDELLTGLIGEAGGFARLRKFANEKIADDWFGGGIGGIEHDQAVFAEGGFEPTAKRLCHADARPIRPTEICQERVPKVCLRQRRCQRVNRSGDSVVQPQPANRKIPGTLEVGQRNRVRFEFRVQHRTTADLRPVVILGVNPEHRHHLHAVRALDLMSKFHGGDRFQQSE